jgi:hypothetical protein
MTALLLALLTASPAPSVVQRLLSPRHGIPPSMHAEYAALCLDAASVDELVGWTSPEHFLPSKGTLTNSRASVAFEVLETWCGIKGQDLTLKGLRTIRQTRDAAWVSFNAGIAKAQKDLKAREQTREHHGHWERLVEVEKASLIRFGAAKNPELVADLLPRVQKDVPLQLAMVTYFTAVARGDSDVATELETLRQNTNSKELQQAIDTWFLP